MLGKLIKYEFRGTVRYFLPFYLAAVALVVINKGVMLFEYIISKGNSNSDFLLASTVLAMMVFVMLSMAIGISTIIFIVGRFYKNLFTDEGYLMHTLPVKASTHIWAKLIVACVWSVISGLVAILGIVIILSGTPIGNEISDFFGNFGIAAEEFQSFVGTNIYVFIAEIGINLIVAIPATILTYYLAVTLGSVMIPKHKAVGGIVVYFIINIVRQILSGGFGIAATLLSVYTDTETAYFNITVIGSMAIMMMLGIASYFISVYVIKNKLNLD